MKTFWGRRMTKEELCKLRYVISALDESLSQYIGWNYAGVDAYWESYEEYEEFMHLIDDARNIIEKELNNEENK